MIEPNEKPRTHRACKVCIHSQRAEIEAAMARGLGKRAVAKRFGISPDSALRHFTNHCPQHIKQAARVKWLAPHEADISRLALAEADGVIVYLRRLRSDLLTAFEAAKSDQHYGSIASISRELRGVLELTAKVSGELTAASKKASAVDLASSVEYLELRSRLLTALRRHPAAYADVIAEFEATERRATAAMIEAQPVEASHVPG